MEKTLMIIGKIGDMSDELKEIIKGELGLKRNIDVVFLREEIEIEGVVDDFKSHKEGETTISVNIVNFEKIENPEEKYYTLFLIGRGVSEEIRGDEKLTSVVERFRQEKRGNYKEYHELDPDNLY